MRFFYLSVNRIPIDIAFGPKVFYHMVIIINEGECGMKNKRSYILCALIGGAYGALGVFLAGIFLKNLGAVAGWIMKILKLEGDIVSQVTDVLSQLKDARLLSPYPVFILIFALSTDACSFSGCFCVCHSLGQYTIIWQDL